MLRLRAGLFLGGYRGSGDAGRDPGRRCQLGLVADRLARSIRRGDSGAELDQRALLERLLAVAAEAEQRITEQTQRIAVLEALSITDELTGLVNRRGFSRELRRALAEAKRYRTGGVLMYMDIDELKKINDLYGHQAGDEVLHRIAELLASHVRATDIVSRLGGDEFAVLIANSPTEDGLTRARELERLVNTSTVAYGGVDMPIHASVGVVTYDGEDEHESLMVRADRAMYSDKHRDERVLAAPTDRRFERRHRGRRVAVREPGTNWKGQIEPLASCRQRAHARGISECHGLGRIGRRRGPEPRGHRRDAEAQHQRERRQRDRRRGRQREERVIERQDTGPHVAVA